MAKEDEGGVKVTETTTKRFTKAEDESLTARVREVFTGSTNFTQEYFLQKCFEFPECQHVRLYRVGANGTRSGLERLERGMDIPELDTYVFSRHQAGDYGMAAVMNGVERAHYRWRIDPASVLPTTSAAPYTIPVPAEDATKTALAKAIETKTGLMALRELSKMEKGEDPTAPAGKTQNEAVLTTLLEFTKSQAEMFRQSAESERTRNQQMLDKLLEKDKAPHPLAAWFTPGIIDTVLKWVGPRLSPELLESFGAFLRGAPGAEAAGWGTPEGIARLLEALGPVTDKLSNMAVMVVNARNAQNAAANPPPVLTNGQPALPAAPPVEAPMPKPSPPQPDKLTETMIAALRKPPEDRKPADLVRLLASITIAQDGTTLLDQWAQIAMIEDETLARVRIEAIDPRLVDEATWGGVRELLQLIREQGEGEG